MTDLPRGAAVLVVRRTDEPMQVVDLGDGTFTIGRGSENDLRVDDKFVSRRHAQIRLASHGYVLEDLGSKNGTYVNGVRIGIGPQPLCDGDQITLGTGVITVQFRSSDATITLMDVGSLPRKGIHVDEGTRQVWSDGGKVEPELSSKEFQLLCLLYRNRGKACSKNVIAAAVWPERPERDVSDDEISQCISRLRRRVERDPSNPEYIMNIRGYGYKLVWGGGGYGVWARE